MVGASGKIISPEHQARLCDPTPYVSLRQSLYPLGLGLLETTWGCGLHAPWEKSSSDNMGLRRPWGDLLSSPKDHWGLRRDRPMGLGTRKAMSYGNPIIEVTVHISTHITGVPWDLMTWLPTA